MLPPDPRVQRLRRSDSFCGPTLDKPQSLKRAPSFSASSVLSKNAAAAKQGKYASANVGRESVSPCPSSDEEEKIRSKKAKKPRVVTAASKPSSPTPTVPSTPLVAPTTSPRPTTRSSRSKPKPQPAEEDAKSSQSGSGSSTCKSGSTVKKVASVNVNNNNGAGAVGAKRPSSTMAKQPRANLQRNPSIFGAPLPQLPQPQSQPLAQAEMTMMRPPSTVLPPAPAPAPAVATTTPQTTKTLRRVKARPANFARRISFGSLVAPSTSESQSGEVEGRRGCFELGSAFQLH
jgi:transcription factor SPN1